MTVLTAAEVFDKMDLRQFGVKGMRWGVTTRSRGKSSSSSSTTPKPEVTVAPEHVKAILAKSKPAAALSNQEMREAIDRMNLEKQYSQLVSTTRPPAPPSRKIQAAHFITGLLVEAGKQEARKVVSAQVNILTRDLLEKKGKTELSRALLSKDEKKHRDQEAARKSEEIKAALAVVNKSKKKSGK